MSKKQASLAALSQATAGPIEPPSEAEPQALGPQRRIPEERPSPPEKVTKRFMVYMPPEVHKQLRKLSYEEEHPMNLYVLRGLDLLFKKEGHKSIQALTGQDVWAD